MRILKLFAFLGLCIIVGSCNQNENMIAKIYSAASSDTTSYHNLRILCKNYPERLAGTPFSSGNNGKGEF